MLPKLFTIDNLIEGSVIKRPSKLCRTPYVADILPVNSGTEVLGHTASLGCCGLADKGASILMAPITKSNNKKQTCQYSIFLSIIREPEKKGKEERKRRRELIVVKVVFLLNIQFHLFYKNSWVYLKAHY